MSLLRMAFLLMLLGLAAVEAADRVVVSFVRPEQVREWGGRAQPVEVEAWDSNGRRVGRLSVPGVGRAGSFVVVEELIMLWVPFEMGSSLRFRLSIPVPPESGASPFDGGEALVRFADLKRANLTMVSFQLNPGSSLGLRLVQPDVVDQISGPPLFPLALKAASVRNLAGTTLFPKFNLLCRSSASGFPNARVLTGGTQFEILNLPLTKWNQLQPVGVRLTLWNANVLGVILSCAVEQADEESNGIFKKGNLGLGVISIDLRQLPAIQDNVALAFESLGFDAQLGPCSTCRLVSPSSATCLGFPVALVLLVLTIATII